MGAGDTGVLVTFTVLGERLGWMQPQVLNVLAPRESGDHVSGGMLHQGLLLNHNLLVSLRFFSFGPNKQKGERGV